MGQDFNLLVRFVSQEVLRDLTKYQQEKIGHAAARALSRVATTVRARIKREISKNTGIPVSAVANGLTINRATVENLVAVVVGRGWPTRLSYFGPRQTKKGVVAKAWGSSKLYRGAFISTMSSGHKGAFTLMGGRRGPPRPVLTGKNAGKMYQPELPLKELWGPSIPSGMVSPEVQALINSTVKDRMPVELTRALAFYAR